MSRPTLTDGPLGTGLMQLGVPYTAIHTAPLTHPTELRQFYDDYIAAGAKMLKTCTLCSYMANSADKIEKISRSAADIALTCAGCTPDTIVAGVLGTPATYHVAYFEQTLSAFADAGINTLLFDTVTSLDIVNKALRYARRLFHDVNVILSGAITAPTPSLADGNDYKALVNFAKHNGIGTVGLNCGTDTTTACELMQVLARESCGLNLYFAPPCDQADAPDQWATAVKQVNTHYNLSYVGPCCQGTPDCLRAMSALIF